MILTVTVNPSIDLSAETEVVSSEHKLRCTAVRRDPGGGGINVARVLKRFGAECRAIYLAGGVLGRLLEQLLQAEGVNGIALDVAEDTRESFTILEKASGREYRFVLAGPTLGLEEWQPCIERVASLAKAGDYVVASGSLPSGVPKDFYGRLARTARASGSRMVLDTSGPPLAAALEEGVFLVKPNLRELRELTGEALESENDWTLAAEGLVKRGRAQIVALSLGHRGALLAAQDATVRAPAIPVKIASTVGAGDSFLAGMVWRLDGGGSLEQAFRYGVAAGTAALLSAGTSLAHKEDTERLARMVELRPLRGEAAIERELDQALEATFPASDPLAVDTVEEHDARRRRAVPGE